MWIFSSILLVSLSLVICSKVYKKMYPDMQLLSTELVLIPFRLIFKFKSKFPVKFLSPKVESERKDMGK